MSEAVKEYEMPAYSNEALLFAHRIAVACENDSGIDMMQAPQKAEVRKALDALFSKAMQAKSFKPLFQRQQELNRQVRATKDEDLDAFPRKEFSESLVLEYVVDALRGAEYPNKMFLR